MDGMIKFAHPRFGDIRVVERGCEPWFVGKDVAAALGYNNPRDALAKHVDKEDKDTVAFHDGTSGNPYMTIINESGLYSLIFSSKLPSAKKFKRWVTSEVLPAIRKHGGYMTPETTTTALLDPDYIIRLALELKAERERRVEMEMEKAAEGAKYADRFFGITRFSDMPAHLFPERLIGLRKERGLTQEGVAKLIDKRRSTVSGYETEHKEPTLDTVCFLAHYFDVSTDYLLGYSDERC